MITEFYRQLLVKIPTETAVHRYSMKQLFRKISQNSQENSRSGGLFLTLLFNSDFLAHFFRIAFERTPSGNCFYPQ